MIRAWVRLILLVLATPLIFTLFLPSLLLKPFGFDNDPWRNNVLTIWGKACCFIAGVKVEYEGNKPDTPFLLVSNHLSYTDTFVYLSLVDVILISKSDVRSWFGMGFMMQIMGMIFVDRSSRNDVTRVNELIKSNFRPNQGIMFFPEATTTNGEDVIPFKGSLLAFPAMENIPVHYATIHYKTVDDEMPASKYVCWWDDTPFFTHLLQLLSMQKFYACVKFGESKIQSEKRKELASRLHQLVRDQYLDT